MKKYCVVVVFMLLSSLCACKPKVISVIDFPIPATAELIYTFPDEPNMSDVFGTDDTVENTAQFFRDSMKSTSYELLKEEQLDAGSIYLEYKKEDKKILISILSAPIKNKKTTISIVYVGKK